MRRYVRTSKTRYQDLSDRAGRYRDGDLRPQIFCGRMLQLCTATTCHCGTNFAEQILLANETGLMHKRASFRAVIKARCGLLRRALFLAREVRRLLCRRSCALEIGLARLCNRL